MSMTGFLGRTSSSQSCRQTKKNPRSWVADFWRGSPLSRSMSMPYLHLSCQAKTDHMLVAHFDPVNGWSAPEIKPYGPLHIDPASSCLQYCSNVFEGLKVRLNALVDGIYITPRAGLHWSGWQYTTLQTGKEHAAIGQVRCQAIPTCALLHGDPCSEIN